MDTTTVDAAHIQRRNTFIRSLAAVTGDIAVGLAFAAACSWVIQAAAFGLFVSFLMWLIASLLCLAVSQYVVHPSVRFLLSDSKLEDVVNTLAGLSDAAAYLGSRSGQQVWSAVKDGWGTLSSVAGLGDLASRLRRT